MKKQITILLIIVMAFSVILGACSSNEPAAPAQPTAASGQPDPTAAPEAPTTLLPMVNPLEVTGDIITAGSSTVFPLAERMAQRFEAEGYKGKITIDSIGSGGGYERFCETGETDIANASRGIRQSEIESCRAIGREPLEFRVGTDALAIVVSKENTFVESLTLAELALVYSTAETWADVNPAWPAEPIQRFSPGSDSGTYDYFVEEVLDDDETLIQNAAGIQFSEDDNVLVQGVLGSQYAIGYFGFAYYVENQDTLKAIAIEGVAPAQSAVDAGEYPLARPLYMYSDAKIMQQKPQVAAYINFFLTYVNEEIVEVGYFPAPNAALLLAKGNLLKGIGTGINLPMVNPLEVTGDIITAGSSTVFPLAERMAQRFEAEGYKGKITIDSIGSGGGYERFCETGETDIANASRGIRQSEIESCRAIGREPLEFRVGTDALAIVVSKENTFVESLTLAELALVYSTAETWADVNPAWPAEPIQRFSPGSDSGTYDYFVEEVLDDDETLIQNAAGIQFSEDDNVLVQGVLGSQYAIGYFGFAYYVENQDTLKAIAIEGVAPAQSAVDAGEYPLARPLYMYSDAKIMQQKPQVAAYINFFLTYVNEEIVEVGYFPAPTSALDLARMYWLDAHMGQ